VTKVTQKGQTSIPQDLREKLGIEAGDEVIWFLEGHRLIAEPKVSFKNPLEELKKMRFRSRKSSEKLAQEAESEFW
jgi:AbrB family looped-hinge helix DNA binding protein